MGELFTFEHTLQVNTGTETPMTADVLWQGLLYRALKPHHFMPQLAKSHVEQLDAHTLHRVLDFGSHQVEDSVVFYPKVRLEARSVADQPMVFCHSLEIVDADELSLVSRYQRPSINEPGVANADDYLTQAYRAADHDMLAQLRAWMAKGTP